MNGSRAVRPGAARNGAPATKATPAVRPANASARLPGPVRPWSVVVAAAAMLASTGVVQGQARDTLRADTVVRLGGIRVDVIQPITTVGGTSALTARLDSMNLTAAPLLEEVLREIPLLHVRTNSRGEAEILSRGSESRQVAVLLDGVPLTLTWDARSDVSVIPATAPREIEFLRGLSSMLHGPNVLGGVVELRVAGEHTPLPRSAQLSTGIDDTGGAGGSASATLPWRGHGGHWTFRGGAGWRDSPGAPLARGIVEPAGGGDGLRLNTDSRVVDGFAAVRYRSDGGPWVSLSTSGTLARRGIAPELDMAEPRFWRYPHVSRAIAAFTGGTGFHDTPFGRGDLELAIGLDAGRTEIDAYTDHTYAERSAFENGDDLTMTLRLLGDHTLGARGDLRLAATWADIRHEEELPAGAARYRQRLWSIGAETLWLLADRAGPLTGVRFTVGGAYDGGDTPEAGGRPAVPTLHDWGARAGLSALLGGAAQLHAGVSRRGRFPALRETYSGALNRFAPNPDLGAEHLTAFEAGVTLHGRTARFQTVAFHHRLDDAIVRITLPDRRFMRVNENQVRTTGVELLAALAVGPATVGGDVAFQSARLITPTVRHGRLENQPARFGGVHIRAPIALGIRGFAEARHTGTQYCLAPTGEDVRLDAGTSINAELSRSWRLRRSGSSLLSRIETRIAADNVTDAALYDQCGLPRPGRLLRFQLRLH